MKILCTQENLLRGSSIVGHCIGKDKNLPILANILLKAEKGVLNLSATNLEMGISCLVRCKVEEDGEITVPASLLLNYISNLKNGNIEIKKEGNSLKLTSNEYCGEIKGISASEFPLIPKIQSNLFCKVKGELVKEALEKTIFSAAREEMKPEISGIYLTIQKNEMRLVATDGYRLSESIIKIEEVSSENISMIVPVLTMQQLLRIIDKRVGNIFIYVKENQVKFVFEEVTLVSKLIEGQYPDYQKIIPKIFKAEIEIYKEYLLRGIKTTSLFSGGDSRELVVRVQKKDGLVELFAEAGKLGKNSAKIKCLIKGEDVQAIFNSRYLTEGLNVFTADKILMKMSGDLGPTMFVDELKSNFLYIVMPIKRQ